MAETNLNNQRNLRIYKTFCLYIALFTIGFCSGIYGPTFLHMQYVLNTDTQGLGLSFIGENIGYLLGTILCGAVFDRWNQELQIFLGCLWQGLSIAISPYVPNVYYYYVLMTVQNLANGFVDSTAPSYILYLWSGHRLKDSLLQGNHATWSLGSFICPFIVIPFLYDLKELDNNHQINNPYNQSSIISDTEHMVFDNISYTLSHSNATIQTDITAKQRSDILSVRYAYVVVGSLCICASLFFLIAFLKGGFYIKRKTNIKESKETDDCAELSQLKSTELYSPEEVKSTDKVKSSGNQKCLKYFLVVLLFLYTIFLFWQDYVINIFISTFVQTSLNWETYKGPLITSVYRGTHGLGRIIGMFIATILSPTKMLLVNMTLATSSLTLFVCSAQFIDSEIPIWLSMAMAGFAYSTSLGSIILWGSRYVEVTAAYGSMFLAATAVGGVSGSSLGAFLFQHYGHIHVFNLSLAASVFNIFLFLVTMVAAKYVTKSKDQNKPEYGPVTT